MDRNESRTSGRLIIPKTTVDLESRIGCDDIIKLPEEDQ